MPMVKLGEVAREYKETCKGDKGDLPIVGLEHLIPEDINLTCWSDDKENTFTKMFRKGHVLFGRRRAYLKKAAVAPFDGICSGDITVIEAIEDKLYPGLLPFIIQNDALFDFAVEKSAGSLSPRVKWQHLQDYEFFLPEMAKQKELAELLWAIDRTKQAYKQLISATDELVKSQFIEMFGDPIKNPLGWETASLLEIGKCKNGMNFTTKESGFDIECLGVSDFQDRMIIDSNTPLSDISLNEMPNEEYLLKDGDIVFVRSNGNKELVGRSVLINVAQRIVTFSGFCIRFRKESDLLNNWFLLYLFKTDSIRKQLRGRGANVQNLNQQILSNVIVPLPPINIQEQFAAFVQQTDKSKFELTQALEALNATYKKLISENLG